MEIDNGYVLVKIPPEAADALTVGKQEQKVVCDVCGYENDDKAAMCKMCSNFLKAEVV